jgi:hypothetical protein
MLQGAHICLLAIRALITFAAIGSIMNIRWVREMGVHMDNYCQIQGAIKQAADIGTAFWTLVSTHFAIISFT